MFGFDIVDGRRVPNSAEAEALREAAKISLKEGRLAPGVKWLNEQGFRTTVGKPFTTVTLRGLFRNRALVGEPVINFKEKAIILRHDSILDAATFETLLRLNTRITMRNGAIFLSGSLTLTDVRTKQGAY
jgi:hypothetical protein